MISNNSDYGISVVLGFAFFLIITAALVGLLIIGFENIAQRTTDATSTNEVQVTTYEMISEIQQLDSNINETNTSTYVLNPSDSVVQNKNIIYTVSQTPDPNIYVLQTTKTSTDTTYTAEFKLNNTDFAVDSVGNSSNVQLRYNSDSNTITFI